jgi:murein DD-endopeptidase MepM/ murein hydrolase activator NlpD
MHHPRAHLAALIAFALVLGTASPSLAATSADVARLRSSAQSARAKAAEAAALAAKLKTETATLDTKVSSLQDQADALDPKIKTADNRTNELRVQVQALRTQVASKTADVALTQARFANEQQLLGERVAASYKQGQWPLIALLLDASSIRDFIARTELVTRVLHANSDAAAQLSATKAILVQQQNDLAHTLEAVSAKRAEAQAVETGLRQLQSQRQGTVDEQRSVLNQKSQLLSESASNAKRLLAVANAEEAESNRIEAELAKARGSGQYHGVMAWPVPGFYRITSSFGWRMHPILKVKRLHTGIDIGKNGNQAIAGASIVAAGSGTVISAGYRSGYGNTVMIDHGNGVVTLYAHQPSGGIKVSTGQHVTKGQRIGTVGMTGYATGPHLHFEVRVNGTPVNPTKYL